MGFWRRSAAFTRQAFSANTVLMIAGFVLIIVVLIPLALRGVRVQAASASHLLRRNLLIYGLGGLIVPFAGIKLIDLLLNALHLV